MGWNTIVKNFEFVQLIEKKLVLSIFWSVNDSAELNMIINHLIWTYENAQIL